MKILINYNEINYLLNFIQYLSIVLLGQKTINIEYYK